MKTPLSYVCHILGNCEAWSVFFMSPLEWFLTHAFLFSLYFVFDFYGTLALLRNITSGTETWVIGPTLHSRTAPGSAQSSLLVVLGKSYMGARNQTKVDHVGNKHVTPVLCLWPCHDHSGIKKKSNRKLVCVQYCYFWLIFFKSLRDFKYSVVHWSQSKFYYLLLNKALEWRKRMKFMTFEVIYHLWYSEAFWMCSVLSVSEWYSGKKIHWNLQLMSIFLNCIFITCSLFSYVLRFHFFYKNTECYVPKIETILLFMK